MRCNVVCDLMWCGVVFYNAMYHCIIAPYQLMASDHCHIDHTILTSSHNSHIIASSCDRVHTSSCHHTISFRMVRSYPHIVLASSSDIVTHTVVTSSHGSHDHAITPSRHILTCSRHHIIASHDIMTQRITSSL